MDPLHLSNSSLRSKWVGTLRATLFVQLIVLSRIRTSHIQRLGPTQYPRTATRILQGTGSYANRFEEKAS
jgi:hypothetical protein